MKIAFLGTPDFAVPSLKMLIEEGHELIVFTQPDRPKGRGYGLAAPPVKQLALERGLPVYQPEKIRTAEGMQPLKEFAPDLMVTAAWGQLLSKENLEIPRYGCINVHGSLLPKYRGAAPIQQAVIDGEKITGITIMMTDVGLDTGDILLVKETPIGADETAGELFDRMAELGAEALKEAVLQIASGRITRTPQEHEKATVCRQLKKEQARIDFSMPAQRIHDMVRGMNPWPNAFAKLGDTVVKIHKTRMTGIPAGQAKPGECAVADSKKGLFVAAGDELLEVLELQFPGSRRMDAKSAMLGRPLAGKRFE